MEHLSPFTNNFDDADEFEALNAFVDQLRTEFDTVSANWYDNAAKRRKAMNDTFNSLESWKQTNVKDYYTSQIRYLGEVMEQPVPYLEISWTTRFNAFLPDGDVWNYLLPDSGRMDKNFESDNEGKHIWPQSGDKIDTINVMAYDAGTPDGKSLRFNFSTILSNFRVQGNVNERKVNMGFEPGEEAARDILKRNSGGAMVWAINPDAKQHPQASQLCPVLAKALQGILNPTYAWGAPTFTKCNPTTGFYPSSDDEVLV